MIIRILSILLAVQRGPAPTLVSSVAREAVTKITVSDTQSEVQLTRSGDRWLLDSGLPADPVKVTAVLTALLEADPGYAIAASDSAARRFKVDADDFERRITLAGGDASASVFLGTSPAFRRRCSGTGAPKSGCHLRAGAEQLRCADVRRELAGPQPAADDRRGCDPHA